MIFYPLQSEKQETEAQNRERLVSVPAVSISKEDEMDQQREIKELLSEGRHRIRLHDFVAQRTRELLSTTGQDYFSVQGSVNNEIFLERMHKYEDAVKIALPDMMLMGRWGGIEHWEILRLPPKRLADRIAPSSGMKYLIESRWYPVYLLLYAGGIGAVAGKNYSAIHSLLHTSVPNPYGTPHGDNLLFSTVRGIYGIHDGFKLFPGHEHQHTPVSEYIFKLLQPTSDDVLFLGSDYDDLFDELEMIMALEHIHISHPEPFPAGEEAWGPVGRFGWKQDSPLQSLVARATAAGANWPPVVGGLFRGSNNRFLELATALLNRLRRVSW